MCSVGFDGDACEVWSETPVVARKQHRCTACEGRIAPGDAYIRHFDIFEGEPSTAKMCFPCWLTREQFFQAHRDGLIPNPAALAETLSDCIEDGDEDSERVWRPLLQAMYARKEAAAHA